MIFELNSEYLISSLPASKVKSKASALSSDDLNTETQLFIQLCNQPKIDCEITISPVISNKYIQLGSIFHHLIAQDGFASWFTRSCNWRYTEKKQNGKQASEAIADFEMIKSAGTINSLKQLISIASRGSLISE
jgi:hypothetical protein